MKKKAILSALMALLLAACGTVAERETAGAGSLDSQEASVDELGTINPAVDARIQELMAEGEIPSLAAAIVIDDELVWAKGYGEQPGLDTVYMVGSIAKPFVTTSVLQLVERGVIGLDDNASDHLPFPLRNPVFPNTSVTVRMLLAHRAGMAHDHPDAFVIDNDRRMHRWRFWAQRDFKSMKAAFARRPDLATFLEEALTPDGKYFRPDFWIAEPGTRYQYSNTGLQQVLPLLVEHVTGMSYPAYVQENILNPLGMTLTGFEASDFEGRLAQPYERVRGKMRTLPRYGWKESGPMRSTATDLARFLIVHLNQGRAGDVQLLEPESVELTHTRVSPLDWPAFFGLRWRGYALGWEVYSDDYQGHPGACPGYMGNLVMRSEAEGGIGVVLLVNRGASIDSVEWAEAAYAPILQTLLDEADRLHAQS